MTSSETTVNLATAVEFHAEIARLQAEVTRLRLTDAEREVICTVMNAYGEQNDDSDCEQIEATLWRLLERTK